MMKILSFVAILGLTSAKIINFKDCGSVGGKMHSLDMTPCDDSDPQFPCLLHHGVNYSMSVNFTATENSNTAETVVYGIIGGARVKFMTEDACKGSVKCPITSGMTYTYTDSIFCRKEYPEQDNASIPAICQGTVCKLVILYPLHWPSGSRSDSDLHPWDILGRRIHDRISSQLPHFPNINTGCLNNGNVFQDGWGTTPGLF